MKNLRWIILLVVIISFGVIIFRNLETTRLELLFTSVELPLAALLSVTLLLGFLLGLATPALWKVRSWRSARHRQPKPKTETTDATETMD